MDYEQKYKEVLERAKRELQTCGSKDCDAARQIYRFFPELQESEDERIRKMLIKFFSQGVEYNSSTNGIYDRDIVAWLEKQGKETSWKPSKEEMDVLYSLAYITNQYDEHKEIVITRLYQDLKREFFNGSSYENMFPTNTSIENDVRRRSTIQVLEYARSLDAYNQFGKADIDKNIAWLEKQGEQKPKWTDEDEERLQSCIIALQGKGLMGGVDTMNSKWLKSLKQRIYVSSAKTCKNDTLLDLLNKMPSYITVDGIFYHFILRKTALAYTAYYAGEEEGSGKVIFAMTAFSPIDLLNEMLEKLKEEGLLE